LEKLITVKWIYLATFNPMNQLSKFCLNAGHGSVHVESMKRKT